MYPTRGEWKRPSGRCATATAQIAPPPKKTVRTMHAGTWRAALGCPPCPTALVWPAPSPPQSSGAPPGLAEPLQAPGVGCTRPAGLPTPHPSWVPGPACTCKARSLSQPRSGAAMKSIAPGVCRVHTKAAASNRGDAPCRRGKYRAMQAATAQCTAPASRCQPAERPSPPATGPVARGPCCRCTAHLLQGVQQAQHVPAGHSTRQHPPHQAPVVAPLPPFVGLWVHDVPIEGNRQPSWHQGLWQRRGCRSCADLPCMRRWVCRWAGGWGLLSHGGSGIHLRV